MNEFFSLLNGSILGLIASAFFGLIWGSFFNVCILRIPEDESLVTTRSHCPKCGDPIPWYLNIPVASYLYLRGRCRNCKARISVQYPLVEIGTALLFVGLNVKFGWGVHFLLYALFTSLLIVISVIDLYHQIIPDELSLPGILLGFIASFFLHDISWWSSLLGIGLGGGLFLGIAYLYEKLAKREGLGGGDVKLLGMIGAWLGYKSILLIIVMSSALGSIVGIIFMLIHKKDFKTAIPFGPFLAIAALVYVFFGGPIQGFLFPDMP